MNTRELAEVIRKEHGYSKAESHRILDTVLESIRSQIKRGDRVRLRNFGTFKPRKYYDKIHCVFDDSKNFLR